MILPLIFCSEELKWNLESSRSGPHIEVPRHGQSSSGLCSLDT
jgi:hypothetical protein